MMCMLTAASHLSKLTQFMLDMPHDTDTIYYEAGEVFFYIFWLSAYLSIPNYNHIPRMRSKNTQRNRVSLALGIATANKEITRSCCNIVGQLFVLHPDDDSIIKSLQQAGQATLNATEATSIHELLERALERPNMRRMILERQEQIGRRPLLAFELTATTVYPLYYKLKMDTSEKLLAMLQSCGVDTNDILFLEEVATMLARYACMLVDECNYEEQSVVNSLTTALNCSKYFINIRDKRTLLYPLTMTTRELPFYNTWNKKYPHRTILYSYDIQPFKAELEDQENTYSDTNYEEFASRNIFAAAIQPPSVKDYDPFMNS